MDWLLFARIALTATFLILAAGGPYAIILLRRFIKKYSAAHIELELRVAALERQLGFSAHNPSNGEHT